MELTYYTSGGSGDGGDQYTGLDRFGRVVDQRWDISGTDVERLKYGYDRASNRVWRQNTVAGSGQDEYYTEDGLYQLATLQRGTLNGGKTGISGTPSWEEDWNHDPLGNWHGTSSGYGKRALVETAMGRYKGVIGPRLRARSFHAQQTEAATGVAILNRMLACGRPKSARCQASTGATK